MIYTFAMVELEDYGYEESALQSITFGEYWDTSNVTEMSYMFYNNANLTMLDLSGWDLSSVNNISGDDGYIKIICDRFVYLKDGYVLMDGTLQDGMNSEDPVLKHFFSRQCPKEQDTADFYNFEFID